MSDIPTRCHKCGSLDLTVSLLNVPPPHWGKMICNECKTYIQWIGSPNKQRKPTIKNSARKELIQLDGVGRCSFCERSQDELLPRQVLELDHVRSLKNGGKDEKENMQFLCTFCHKLKNCIMIHAFKKGDLDEGNSTGVEG